MSSVLMNNIVNAATTAEVCQVLSAWNRIHDKDQRSKLNTLARTQLVNLAGKLGLDQNMVSIYGNTTYKNTWINAIQIAYDSLQSANNNDEFGGTNAAALRKEWSKLDKERTEVQNERDEFENAQEEALNAAQQAWTNLERAKAELGVSTIEERTAFAQKVKGNVRAEKALKRREHDLKRREDEFRTQTEAFHRDTARHEEKTKKHFENLQKAKAVSTKRKRENDVLAKELAESKLRKHRFEHDVAVALKRFNGEAYWSYACPPALSGANEALWRRYKCKQLVPGSEYTSDRLRQNDRVPKWKSLTEVEQALTETLLSAAVSSQ